MLDNEPEGGERTGVAPAGDTVDSTGATGTTGRIRATRRRSAAVPDSPASTDQPAGTDQPADPASKTRRRRKAVLSIADSTGVDPADPGGSPGSDPAEQPTSGPVDPLPVKKATRIRTQKVAPVVVPAEESVPEPGVAAPPAVVSASGVPEGSTAATEPLATQAPGAEPVVKRSTRRRSVRAEGPPAVSGLTGDPAVVDGRVDAGAPAVVSAPVDACDQTDSVEQVEKPARGRRRAVASPPAVLFMAPDPRTPAPADRRTASGAPEPAGAVLADIAETAAAEPGAGETVEPARKRRRGRRTADADAVADAVAEPELVVPEQVDIGDEVIVVEEEDDDDEDTPAGRRRRRRGRRGRGRGKGVDDDTVDEEPAEVEVAVAEEGDEDGESLTRRRRRRRRRGSGEVEAAAEDGVPTVVKIRESRRTSDEVQGVSGSTRLEAKRQRRRDGREQRRTRPPILSESEFLARREAVDRDMVIRQRGDRTQIAVLEDGVLVEHYVTRASSATMAGNVYLGKVQNVLPSMEAAFVDVGRGRNAVLYAGEVNWDASGLAGRARSIEQALRSGDSVLVQVTKDPIGHKGARLTSHIALSGRHLVYVPNGNASGISRKLSDTERKRLRDILKRLVPESASVIVRTAAEGANEDELARDVKRLQAQWEDIQAKLAGGGAPVLLYEEPDLVIRVVRDLFNEDFRELVIQGDESYEMVESYLAHVSPDLLSRLRRHASPADVFADRRIDEQILKGLDRKVFLPSGGHLVIDRTEAMTVIDVNTGKYTGAGGNLEETVTRNNLEAAEEIVRQLRLRDIGGIIVIDFIDMVLESNRDLVLRRLTECLGRDRTKHQVTEITSLGLVQMTRKRIGAGLLEAFSETCDSCKGRGLIMHTEPAPEKPRGAVDKVKAVATATTAVAPATGAATTGARRRGRKAAQPVIIEPVDDDAVIVGPADESPAEPAGVEPVAVEAVALDSGAVESGPGAVMAASTGYDEDDTMGYDLSRYEVEPVIESGNGAVPARLAGADDPDAAVDADADTDADGGSVEAGSGGRRRIRRGSTRRRTRP